MKKNIKSTVSVILFVICLLSFSACGNQTERKDVWESATYCTDTELGEGEKNLLVEVMAEEKLVTFTIHTDEKTVGAALFEHNLISGDESEFGLYVKTVNGIFADFNVTKSYWGFYIDGEYATSGVDSTEIEEGVTYRLAYVRE